MPAWQHRQHKRKNVLFHTMLKLLRLVLLSVLHGQALVVQGEDASALDMLKEARVAGVVSPILPVARSRVCSARPTAFFQRAGDADGARFAARCAASASTSLNTVSKNRLGNAYVTGS